ncbi:MAG: hypothetical protein KHW67_01190, partial [Lachnospiraceae bacterium]|nr:hypothetical protein [Lachnospiraceae bacterium]
STKNGYFSVFCGSISHAFSCKHETHDLLTLVSCDEAANALLLDEQEAQAFRTERCFVATCKRCCGNDKIANRSEVKEREISLAAEKT